MSDDPQRRPPHAKGVENPPDLDDEDEAILDAIWDRRGREQEQNQVERMTIEDPRYDWQDFRAVLKVTLNGKRFTIANATNEELDEQGIVAVPGLGQHVPHVIKIDGENEELSVEGSKDPRLFALVQRFRATPVQAFRVGPVEIPD